ncbi:MAG: hypothetical protein WBL25_13860 [Anaerolineales bacterium]
MSLWSKIQIGLGVIGFLLALVGDRFSIPLLLYAGIATFGVTSIVVGLEAMLTQRMVLSRQRNYSETFLGLAAYAQGVQFSLIGLFFIGASVAAYLDNGDQIFMYFVRRPWSVLVVIGMYCLMQAVIMVGGSIEQKQRTRWVLMLDFFAGRLLPGTIFIVIGLGALGLGLFEFVAPTQFDALGGGFLEVLFGG